MKVSFELDWYPTPEHGGFFDALVKNYYKDAGLDVTIDAGGPGSFGIQKVATGRAEFAMGRADAVIVAIHQGLPLVIVCAEMQHDPQAIMFREGNPIRSFRDLDGKTVMVSPGMPYIPFLEYKYGIKINTIPSDYTITRFLAEPGFIQQCFISNEPFQAQLEGVKARALLIADSGFDPYRVIFTSRAFAREHPEAVKAFVAASIRGWVDYLHGDPTEACARIMKEDPAEPAGLMKFSIDAMKSYRLVEGDPAKGERVGLITPERFNALLEILVKVGTLDATMPLDRFVDFNFLPPAPKPGAQAAP
jgi:NitT/TauT family transport system substrate-binding protein